MDVCSMPRNKTLNDNPTVVLQGIVFSLLSKNERGVVTVLGKAAHPLSLSELNVNVKCHYRTLKRVVRRLEDKKIVFTFRDVIKVVSLNPVLTKGVE
jgi:predicted transcriptional regulator